MSFDIWIKLCDWRRRWRRVIEVGQRLRTKRFSTSRKRVHCVKSAPLCNNSSKYVMYFCLVSFFFFFSLGMLMMMNAEACGGASGRAAIGKAAGTADSRDDAAVGGHGLGEPTASSKPATRLAHKSSYRLLFQSLVFSISPNGWFRIRMKITGRTIFVC